MKFGNGEISNSTENKILVKGENSFDFLFFFDSRAMTIDEDNHRNTTLIKLLEFFEKKNISYLAISRPKNLTIFATLLNFLELNKGFKFKNLVTNLGFVDYTPKKQVNIDDMLLQINQFSFFDIKICEKENYILNGGECETMKILDYPDNYTQHINKTLSEYFKNIFFVNTPIIPKDIIIERKRPNSFFEQLQTTNLFINKLESLNKNSSKLIDIGDISNTFDAVHFTKTGHKQVYEKIIKELNL